MSSEAIESTLGVNQAPAKALSSPDELLERVVVDELGQTLTSDNCWTRFPADDESNQSRLDQSQEYKRDWTQDLDEGSKSDQDSVVDNSEEQASKRDLPQGPVDDIDQSSMENSTGESGDGSGQNSSQESSAERDGSSSSDSSQGSVTSDTRSQAALESGDESDGSSSSSDSSQGPVTSDTRTQAALAEIDQLSEDLRSKHASAHGRDSDRPPVLTEDDKVKLALRKSQAQVPGAFHESDEPDVKPATQDQISGLIRLKKSQKQRSPVGEDLGNPDSSTDGDVLEEMQDAMVEFQKNTNDEDAEAEAAAMKRKGRKKWGIISAVAVLLIGVIVGAAVGLTSGGETTSPEKEVPLTEEESCSAGAEDNLPERYAELQSLIVTDLPGMTSDIDTPGSSARTSLCWLVFSDALEAEAQEEDIVQRFVLGAIYFHFDASLGEGATNGLSLSNWLSPLPACEWEFIVCGLDMVQEIALSGLELRGFIPTELSLLTQLVHLKLDSNVLKGSLPSEVGKLVDLRQLAMGKNLLSGAIPDLSGLSNLSHFDIGFNARLEGTFPDIFGATNLEVLDLNAVAMTGDIPSELWGLTKLSGLSFDGATFGGVISTAIGELVSLEYLDLSNMPSITENIPSEIGNLSLLKELYLDGMRQISGTIPSELGRLSYLESLHLENSEELSGTVAAEICLLLNSSSLVTLEATCGLELSCECCTTCH